MICYEFGKNYEKIYDGIYWREKTEDYPIYHTHDYWEFVICKSGSYEHNINNKIDSLDVGEAILLAPGDFHSLKYKTKKASHLNIVISSEYFEKKCNEIGPEFLDFFKQNHFSKVKFSFERLSKIESHFKNILISTSDEEISCYVSFVIFNLLEPMFTSFKSKSQEMPDWFIKLLIECSSNEHLNWKPRDACEFVNYSQAHVNRVFRKNLNTTLVDYLIKIKMDAAVVLLTNSDLSLSDIVSTLGYNSVSYFSHTFKKYYKVSPYRYKTSFRKGKAIEKQ